MLNRSRVDTDTQVTIRNGLRFFALTLERPRLLAAALAATIIATLSTVAAPRLLGLIIDGAISPRDAGRLTMLVAIYAGFEVLRMVSTGFHSYYFQVLGQKTLMGLRDRLFSHLLELPVTAYERTTSGLLGTRLVSDVNVLSALFQSGFVRIIERALTVLFIVVSILILDFQRGAVCLGFIAVFSIFAAGVSSRLYRAYGEIRMFLGDFNSLLTEALSGVRNIKLFNRERKQARTFEQQSASLARARLKPIMLFASLHAAMTLVVGGSMFFLIWFGGADVQAGRLSLGNLIALISYVLWLFWPIMQIVNEWSTFLSGMAAAERVFELFDWPKEKESVDAVTEVPKLKGHIIFENVWFAYHGERWVLRDLTFEIHPGTSVALCGPTGAGKSSLLGLLLRFHEPQRGRILIDGIPLDQLPRKALRKQLGLVQQEVFLFSGSLKDNISLWDDAVPVTGVPPRYEELDLSEGGVNVSLGERQYLAFLRTLARNPSLWLVDEATSYLDPSLDHKLMQLLRSAAAGKTVFTVAHRLAGVTQSDKILVLHHGQLVEQGTHQELIELDGLYAKMYRVQAASLGIKRRHEPALEGKGG